MEELEVPGFGDAVISLPTGATAKRPVVVAVHGLRHRPDWQCRIARRFVGDRAFVLCPRGVPAPALNTDGEWRRFTFARADDMLKEIDAGLAALKRAYPDYVDDERPLYYGHSLGAIFGAAIVLRDPARWTRAALAEGGHGSFTHGAARSFVTKRGQRILFACGTPDCLGAANWAARVLEGAGGKARVAYAEGAGHRSYGAIVDAVGESFDWLLDGDPRFR